MEQQLVRLSEGFNRQVEEQMGLQEQLQQAWCMERSQGGVRSRVKSHHSSLLSTHYLHQALAYCSCLSNGTGEGGPD